MFRNGSLISLSNEVKNALSKSKMINKDGVLIPPIVALESTVITHGLPYPKNMECAIRAENAVRNASNGLVVPATIAVMDGMIKIGLTNDEIKKLASNKAGVNAIKLSRRDISSFLGIQLSLPNNNMVGGTTVSSTMLLANMVGISIFATGGIGGVHRDAFISIDGKNRPTLDVSADLYELGRTPVLVVSAGIKSILDVPHSLELLESLGVTVASYKSEYFPNFYSTSSTFKSPLNIESIEQISKIWETNRLLNIQSGMLLAVPNPKPYFDSSKLEDAISTSLNEASTKGISGKYVTPYILKRVNEITGGKDVVESNITLIENNARIAALIAKQFAYPEPSSSYSNKSMTSNVIFIGGSAIDIIASPKSIHQNFINETSNPGKITVSPGGVARNMAEACARMNNENSQTKLITLLGNDPHGDFIRTYTESAGVRVISATSDIRKSSSKITSSAYIGLNNSKGNLSIGVFDGRIMEDEKNEEYILKELENEISDNHLIYCIDANMTASMIEKILKFIKTKKPKLILAEPVSIPKAKNIVPFLSYFSIITPNSIEVLAMAQDLGYNGSSIEESGKIVLNAMKPNNDEVKAVIIKLGKDGAMIIDNNSNKTEIIPAPNVDPNKVVNSNGCGDTMCGVIASQLSIGKSIIESVKIGMEAAVLTLQCYESVSPAIGIKNL